MWVGSRVFLVNLLQFLVVKDFIIGILPGLLLTAVQPQRLLFLGRLLFVGSADWSVTLFDALLLPLQGFEFLLRNVGDFLVFGHVFVDLAQVLHILVGFSSLLLLSLLVHVKFHLLAQYF